MPQPLVTIAIPAYKADFIEMTIKSALAQTYENIEVIVVDDASPNDIKGIADKFTDDKRFAYCRNKQNVGREDPSANWNECLKYAKGEFVCILCDDDMYHEDYVKTMVELAERHPDCNVFRSGVKETDGNGNVTSLYPLAPEHEDIAEYIWHLHSGNGRQTMSEWMTRRKALMEIGGYVACPMAWGSDCCTMFRLAEHGGVASSPRRLMSFRKSDCNITGQAYSNIPQKIIGWNRQCDTAREIINRTDTDIKHVALHEIERDRKIWNKMYIKRACISDLNLMWRDRDTYHLTLGRYIGGITRNILWALRLEKKRPC